MLKIANLEAGYGKNKGFKMDAYCRSVRAEIKLDIDKIFERFPNIAKRKHLGQEAAFSAVKYYPKSIIVFQRWCAIPPLCSVS